MLAFIHVVIHGKIHGGPQMLDNICSNSQQYCTIFNMYPLSTLIPPQNETVEADTLTH